MKTCPDCGERVFKLGCVNCDEELYIEEQWRLNELWPSESYVNDDEVNFQATGEDEAS